MSCSNCHVRLYHIPTQSAIYQRGIQVEMNFFTFFSCEKDVKSHLRQLKVPQTCVRSEKELILARGLFNQDDADETVCPKHRAALGARWRQNLKCHHEID